MPNPARLPTLALALALALGVLVLAACGPVPAPDGAGDDDRPDTAVADPARMPADPPAAAPATDPDAGLVAAPWAYVATAIPGESRPQKAATLRNLRPDADDPGSFAVVPTVQLVLRDDPRWGQSVYLVVEEGHFDCGEPCAFLLRFDDGAARRWAGRTASTGTRPALFIEDDAAFVAALPGARRLEIAPADGGTAPIVFAVEGFAPARYAAGR